MVVRSKGVTFQFWVDSPFKHNPPAVLVERIVVRQTLPYFGDNRAMVQTFERGSADLDQRSGSWISSGCSGRSV